MLTTRRLTRNSQKLRRVTEKKKRGGARPNSGPKPGSGKGSNQPLYLRLAPEDMQFVQDKGGNEFVRSLIREARLRHESAEG